MQSWVGWLPAFPGSHTLWVVFSALALLGCTVVVGLINVTSVAWIRMKVASEASVNPGELLIGPEALRTATRRYQQSDPTIDAQLAHAKGDRRLLGGITTGPFIPGTPDELYQEYEETFGVRLLYAGCVVASEEEAQYREAVDRYAKRYNVALLASSAR